MPKDEAAINSVVEQLLTTLCKYVFEAMPACCSIKDNIGGTSLKNGSWGIFTMIFKENLKIPNQSPAHLQREIPFAHWAQRL